ncbi:hypothetical protein BDA96_02G250300 [Sorghum bicolor]|uniref:Uncharacterized protein n=1 Tax=Sorghum bicolor TaxID=4558 RepID=A0A921UUT9_SORBI|nr:hypothetical protein BDA96_02G250300 [Sorghum bicolor]
MLRSSSEKVGKKIGSSPVQLRKRRDLHVVYTAKSQDATGSTTQHSAVQVEHDANG